MKIRDVLTVLDALAPFSGAEEWDNGGLLVGAPDDEVSGILVALDVTAGIVGLAQKAGANLIVAHHPVIFHAISAIGSDSAVYKAIAAGIGIIGFHTCYDNAPKGVSYLLAKVCGLKSIEPAPDKPCLLLGECDFPDTALFAAYIRDVLGSPCVRFVKRDGAIRRAAVCGGAGGEFLEAAAAAGADVFLTGECKYHDYLRAYELKIALVTAGHYETEALCLQPLAAHLKKALPEVPVTAFAGKPPIQTL